MAGLAAPTARHSAYALTRFGSPATAFARIEQDPALLQEGEIRIEVDTFGINFADVVMRRGLYRGAPKLPFVPGYEVVGRIIDLRGVPDFQCGQRVLAFTRFGAYAEQVVTDARLAIALDDGVDAGVACALATQFCTAYYCSEELVRPHAGDRVLVHAGAGGVGSALVQMLLHKGCDVFATAGSPEKVDLVKRLGAHHVIDYRREDFEQAVRRITGSAGLDVVYDSIGGKVLSKSRRLLGPGGRLVMFGASSRTRMRGGPLWNALATAASFGLLSPALLLLRSQSMLGVNMLELASHKPLLLRRCLVGVMALFEKGAITPLPARRFPVTELACAHELLESRLAVGKVVVTWQPAARG